MTIISQQRFRCNLHVIKSRRMRWAGHVVLMGEGKSSYKVLLGRPEGRDQ